MDEWDLIVVGAGSAGSVIAARASENPRQRVLLVEAGPDYPDRDSLPEDLAEKPHGHGRLVFHSADPQAQPAIETNFLHDDWDLERMVEGVEIALRVTETSEIRAVTERILRPRAEVAADHEALRSWIRRACGSGFHPCGTVPMGAPDDRSAVVDQYGRVFGVEGLFVADASIMPTIPRQHQHTHHYDRRALRRVVARGRYLAFDGRPPFATLRSLQ